MFFAVQALSRSVSFSNNLEDLFASLRPQKCSLVYLNLAWSPLLAAAGGGDRGSGLVSGGQTGKQHDPSFHLWKALFSLCIGVTPGNNNRTPAIYQY